MRNMIFLKRQRQLTIWVVTWPVSCLRLTEFVSADSKPTGLQSCRLFPRGGMCKASPLLWDLRFRELEGGGGIADCISFEGEDWLRDERGCRVLYEREDEIGQVGIRRVGVSTKGRGGWGETELHDLCWQNGRTLMCVSMCGMCFDMCGTAVEFFLFRRVGNRQQGLVGGRAWEWQVRVIGRWEDV